ncbi:MAG: CPBP family intramembrane metalloprotease [Candidatus Aminicenantes bacterium]|nr:MAG: CPBP family intramembrane metalloprotease [Candidatus Aminicenantes bacterium]
MKSLIGTINPGPLCKSEQIKPTVILILSALLPTIHRYFGSIEFMRQASPSMSDFDTAFYMFGTAFLLMGILPLAIIHFVFREPLKTYGLQLGDWRKGLPVAAILFILIAGFMLYPSSQTGEMSEFYPFDKSAGDSVFAFVRFEALRGVLFYTAWEFFFRGFMLFGLRRYLGDWMAICIQTIPSCLWHIGTPTGEIFASILGGILFGVFAIRTRSILWAFLLHWLIGIGMDLFIVMRF